MFSEEWIELRSKQIVLSNRVARNSLLSVPQEGMSLWAHAVFMLPDFNQHLAITSGFQQHRVACEKAIAQMDEYYATEANKSRDDLVLNIEQAACHHAKLTAISVTRQLARDAVCLKRLKTRGESNDSGFDYRLRFVNNSINFSELNRTAMLKLLLKPLFDAMTQGVFESSVLQKTRQELLFGEFLRLSERIEFIEADFEKDSVKEDYQRSIWNFLQEFEKKIFEFKQKDELFLNCEYATADSLVTNIPSLMLRGEMKQRVIGLLSEKIKQYSAVSSAHPLLDPLFLKSQINDMIACSKALSVAFSVLEDDLDTLLASASDHKESVTLSNLFCFKNKLRLSVLEMDRFIAETLHDKTEVTLGLMQQQPAWKEIITLCEVFFAQLPKALSGHQKTIVSSISQCLMARLLNDQPLQQSIGRSFITSVLNKESDGDVKDAVLASLTAKPIVDSSLEELKSNLDREFKSRKFSPSLNSHFTQFILGKMQQSYRSDPTRIAEPTDHKRNRLRDIMMADAAAADISFRCFEHHLEECRLYIHSARISDDPQQQKNFHQFSTDIKSALLESYTAVLNVKLQGGSKQQQSKVLSESLTRLSNLSTNYMSRLSHRKSYLQQKALVYLTLGVAALVMLCYHRVVYGEFSVFTPRSYSATKVGQLKNGLRSHLSKFGQLAAKRRVVTNSTFFSPAADKRECPSTPMLQSVGN